MFSVRSSIRPRVYSQDLSSAAAMARIIRRALRRGKQAEALAQEQVNLIKRKLATKADLAGRVSNRKVELLKWMFGALIAQGGLIATLIKLL